nr:ABC transporter C family member 12-like isoform X1 [Ipomoea batatas]
MSIKPLIWYCRPVANGIWAQKTDSAFGAYTPCAIESVDFISYLVHFGLCLYRIWLIKMDHKVKRFCLRANCYNYILIFLGCLCAAQPLARLAMGISIFNLDSQTGLAPFEIVSLGCQILAWSSIIIMIGMETRMYIKEFRWYIRFGVIYVLVGEAVILNLIISMMEFYARLMLLFAMSNFIILDNYFITSNTLSNHGISLACYCVSQISYIGCMHGLLKKLEWEHQLFTSDNRQQLVT